MSSPLSPFLGPTDQTPPFESAPVDSVVCRCHQVTESTIQAAIDDGAGSVPELTLQTGAGRSCRGCHCRMDRMISGLPPCSLRCRQCGCTVFLCACEAA